MSFRFLKDDSGISTIEFVIVMNLFFLLIFGIVDFSRAMWEWNAAAKATQAGVRFAVVSDIVALNLRNLDGTTLTAIGTPVPAGAITPNPTICTIAGCGTSLGSLSDPVDATAFGRIVLEMQKYYDSIQDTNVVVEYLHIGLGMAGNPGGPDIDPVTTVRLRDLDFIVVTPGLANLVPTISLPGFVATLSGEDGRG